MRVLIAGAGKVTREILRRIGQSWSVTLVDLNSRRLVPYRNHPQITRRVVGDASSLVTLQKAGLSEHDFVVAVTNRDPVNQEVCRLARAQGLSNIAALVNDSFQRPEFRKLGVRAVCGSELVAREIELFLESPRLFLTTIAEGTGEVMEVQVLRSAPAVGKRIRELQARDWLVAAIHRAGELIIPHGDTVILADDELTVVGRSDLYRSIAHLFTFEANSFPLEFGQSVLLPVEEGEAESLEAVADEALYLTTNTRAQRLTLLVSEAGREIGERIRVRLKAHAEVEMRQVMGHREELLVSLTHRESVGCAVLPPKPLGPLARLLGLPTLVALAHRLASPLLVSRRSTPYRRLLVPCSGTQSTGLALEIAIDLAQQVGATVDAVVVTDPLAHQGCGSSEWGEKALGQARQIGQLHSFAVGEVRVEGNPVHEITALAKDYNLLVLGSTIRNASLLRPHVGEQLVQRASCSVLVVT